VAKDSFAAILVAMAWQHLATWKGIVVERRYVTRGFFSQLLAVLDMAAGFEIL
jgi:nitrogen fixation protein FixH